MRHARVGDLGRALRKQRRNFIASQRAGNLQKSLEAAFPSLATLLIFALAQNASGPRPLQDLGTFLHFYAAFRLSARRGRRVALAIGELLVADSRIERLKPIISTATEIQRRAEVGWRNQWLDRVCKCRSARRKRAADSG